MLKANDKEAEKLYVLWLSVRQASWDIRKSIDENDLNSDSPKVINPVIKAKKIRNQLIEGCRTYFASQTNILPTVKITVSDTGVKVDWNDPVMNVEKWTRKIVLIEICNEKNDVAHITMKSDSGRQILFWQKDMTLEKGSSIYTFAYIAPTISGDISGKIYVLEDNTPKTQFTIRAYCTAQAEEKQDDKSFKQSIKFHVRDAETSKPIPVRVEVRDAEDNSKAYWTPLKGATYTINKGKENVGFYTKLWDFQPGPFFYIDGKAELGVSPKNKIVRMYHGYEYNPVIMNVPEDGVVDVSMERWINMPANGWFSGQTHIHTTDVGMPVQFSHIWPVIARAEDLRFSNVLTLKGEWTIPLYADEYPMGIVPWASTDDYIISFGEEYRSNPYGHLCLLGISKLVNPISSGALGELVDPDYPPNTYILDETANQGGTAIGAHFGLSILTDREIKSGSWPSTGYEMPVDIALGKLNIAEIFGAGGQVSVWYKLLNCGFDVTATAGPDWVMKDTPRAYVYLGDKSFTQDNWLDALKHGKSFITFGPMMSFTIDGVMPGDKLNYDSYPKSVLVKAKALLPGKSVPVEIVVNGKVVEKGVNINKEIILDDSCWIAARCDGAHTTPVYVTLAGRPRGSVKDAAEFIGAISKLEEWVKTKALFDTTAQKETVLKVLESGRNIYEDVIEREKRQKEKQAIPHKNN